MPPKDQIAQKLPGNHGPDLSGIHVIPPLKGLSSLKDTPGVSGGNSADGDGVQGNGGGVGVHGISYGGGTGIGVFGECQLGRGVVGVSKTATGVEGNSNDGVGVWGMSNDGVGVWGMSDTYEGMHAETKSPTTAALAAYQMNAASDSAALYAKHVGNRTAAVFEGNVVITGHIEFSQAADCAEDFDISAESCAEPGAVMALDEEGNLRESCRPYDKRVAGVISGAGFYKPGLVLDKQQSQSTRKAIALLGKVFCKVDAQFGSIMVGDLLTTSSTVGHAMRVDDPVKAFGAVIGKALRPQADGQGLIPILIALQ